MKFVIRRRGNNRSKHLDAYRAKYNIKFRGGNPCVGCIFGSYNDHCDYGHDRISYSRHWWEFRRDEFHRADSAKCENRETEPIPRTERDRPVSRIWLNKENTQVVEFLADDHSEYYNEGWYVLTRKVPPVGALVEKVSKSTVQIKWARLSHRYGGGKKAGTQKVWAVWGTPAECERKLIKLQQTKAKKEK